MRKAPVKQYGKKWIDQEIRKFILKNKFSQFTIFYKNSKNHNFRFLKNKSN